MKRVVVDRGARPTGTLDNPASSARRARTIAVADPDPGVVGGVRAVLVERLDATCVLYRGGPVGEWSSLAHAWDALRAIDPLLEWRPCTPGVWIGSPSEPGSASSGATGLASLASSGASGKSAPPPGSFAVARALRGRTGGSFSDAR